LQEAENSAAHTTITTTAMTTRIALQEQEIVTLK